MKRTGNPFSIDRYDTASEYYPEWDVQSLHRNASDLITTWVKSTVGLKTATNERKIIALLSGKGYGKTHLFGRIASELEQDIFMVFVRPDKDQDLESSIRWSIVDRLFADDGLTGHTYINSILARICASSFREYLDWLPSRFGRRHEDLRQRLNDDELVVNEIIATTKSMAPFTKLADSATSKYDVSADLIRALFLSWSPKRDITQQWLRGDTVDDDERKQLLLSDRPPLARELLQAVAALFDYETPIVLCCDQIEPKILTSMDAAMDLANTLVGILQTVPSLQIVISCFSDVWSEKLTKNCPPSFLDRMTTVDLDPIDGNQAIDLVERRLKTWNKYDPLEDRVWPFDQNSLRAWADSHQVSARALLQKCKQKLDDWMDARKVSEEAICLTDSVDPDLQLDRLFCEKWIEILSEAERNTRITAKNTPEEQLYRGVFEVLSLLKYDSDFEVDGVRISALKEYIVPQGGTSKRFSIGVHIDIGGLEQAILVVVTKLDSAHKFSHFFSDIFRRMESDTGIPIVGTVIIHHDTHLPAGEKTRGKMKDCGEDRLRTVSLRENHDFKCVDCFLSILRIAETERLNLSGVELSADDCRDRVVRNRLMRDLALVRQILAAWPVLKRQD